MKRMTRLACIAAGMAVAGTIATANAGKPLTPQERQAKVAELKQNHRNFQQPRTIAQAEARAVRQPDGTTALAMPTELWSHLSVQRDAAGRPQLHETEGDATQPTATTGGADHD